MKLSSRASLLFLLLFLFGCEGNQMIVNNIDERDANEIVVYLASKGVPAYKVLVPVPEGGGGTPVSQFNIMVDADHAVDAMALLNRVGLPRRLGPNLLTLFAKSGLMSSDREETIRYQAGLEEELQNTIRKIDGVLDADVQISFPPSETALPGSPLPKATAAVYVKHQGILDDPNSHLEVKIKRLVAGSVNGLDYNDVAVISDRSRLADIRLTPGGEPIGLKASQETYVTIWGLVMPKNSLLRFRVIFFTFIILILLALGAMGWMAYKFYPQLKGTLLKKKGDSSEPPLNP